MALLGWAVKVGALDSDFFMTFAFEDRCLLGQDAMFLF
jgi:hypothetical protein